MPSADAGTSDSHVDPARDGGRDTPVDADAGAEPPIDSPEDAGMSCVCPAPEECAHAECVDGECVTTAAADGENCGDGLICVGGGCVERIGCGDGYAEPDPDHAREECDDGNAVPDDLCTNECTLRSARAVAPIATPTSAREPLFALSSTAGGAAALAWAEPTEDGIEVLVRRYARSGRLLDSSPVALGHVPSSAAREVAVAGLETGWAVAFRASLPTGAALVAGVLTQTGGLDQVTRLASHTGYRTVAACRGAPDTALVAFSRDTTSGSILTVASWTLGHGATTVLEAPVSGPISELDLDCAGGAATLVWARTSDVSGESVIGGTVISTDALSSALHEVQIARGRVRSPRVARTSAGVSSIAYLDEGVLVWREGEDLSAIGTIATSELPSAAHDVAASVLGAVLVGAALDASSLMATSSATGVSLDPLESVSYGLSRTSRVRVAIDHDRLWTAWSTAAADGGIGASEVRIAYLPL